jgi:hypothetical protein
MNRDNEGWLKTVEAGAPLLWEAAMNPDLRKTNCPEETDPSKMDREQKRAYLMEKHRADNFYGPRRADG